MASDLLHNLLDILHKTERVPVKGHTLADWRISLYQTQMVTLGIKNNIGGSVYTPPTYRSSESADIFLVWKDGKCSRARVARPDGAGGYDWGRELSLWRMAAFEDPYALKIPVPAKLQAVEIYAEGISNIIEKDLSSIFNQEGRILADRPREAQTSANIMAQWGKNYVHTSTGINVDYKESRYAVSWAFDSQISEGFAKRRLITEQEWAGLWPESVAKYHLLKKQGEPVEGETLVILAPSVVEQMIEQYILPNFRGENILEGQSRFRTGQFTGREKCLHRGLTLEINPLRPYNWASYLLTAEGIPATKTRLVENGLLQSPYLNVKDACRWGIEVGTNPPVLPTAIPHGASGIIVNHSNQIGWPQMREEIENGVLILSVLGLHTQNPVTGSFSLAAPSSLRIRNGQFTGKTDVRISGNIWDIFKSERTRYGRSESDRQPYILAHCQTENL